MTVYWLEQGASDVPPEDDWLCTAERALLGRFRSPKRRADWRLGRWTAKNAMAACLNLSRDPQTLARVEIRAAESGAPQAFIAGDPADISISLSHRETVAACVIAPAGTMLGCDLEVVEPRSAAFVADYFTTEEQQLVAGTAAPDRSKVANLLWSAKESALKALTVGLRADSRSAIVTSIEGLAQPPRINLTANEGHSLPRPGDPAQWHSLRVSIKDGRAFHGWWRQSGLLLRTLVAYPAPDQPEMLALM